MSVRVGFATTDGGYIDEHFGHAMYWDVYDIGEEVEFVATRKVKASCSCHNKQVFDDMLSTLEDCEVLFVAKIGQEAAAHVINKGKRVFEAVGDLYKIIPELVRTRALEPQITTYKATDKTKEIDRKKAS